MKIIDVQQRSDEWQEARRGKLTGTRLKDLVVLRGNKRKIGFYEVLAERIAYAPDGQNPMERGVELEEEALDKVSQYLEKPIEQVGFCVREDYPEIAISPDGLIKEKGKYTGAVEIKCLSTARHLQILIEKEVPSDYKYQVLQYFIVNDDLETLFFCSYDPRMIGNELVVLPVNRQDVQKEVKEFREYQIQVLDDLANYQEQYGNF